MIEKRTKKIFHPYNEYVDRGMALKWRTAFELGELNHAIKKSENDTLRNIKRLPQQSFDKISYCLDQSIKYNKLLNIQLNSLDELGRVKPHVTGTFRGFTDEETILIGETTIEFSDVRHIVMVDFTKWFNIKNVGQDPFAEVTVDMETVDFTNDYFDDGGFSE